MNTIKYTLVFFILNILIVSCTFEPDELGMEKVQPLAETPVLSIDIKNLSPYDTIIARYNSIDLELSAFTDGKRILDFSVLKGTDEQYDYKTVPDYLSFELYSLQEGLNEITLQLIVGSGTNSLADQLDAEGYIIEFPFYIYKVPEDTRGISTISESVVDGRLKLQWNPYPYPDFQAYSINGLKITNQNITSLIDSSYIEKHRRFNRIIIMASDRTVSNVSTPTLFGIPNFTVEPKDNHIQISWGKTKFYNSFNKYTIFITNFPNFGNYFKLFETNDINDTSAISFNCLFGRKFDVDIQYLRDNEELGAGYSTYDSKVIIKQVEIGELSPYIEGKTFMMNPQNGDIIMHDKGDQTVSFLDEDQNALLNTTKLGIYYPQIMQSQNGTYWGLLSSYDIRSFNPVTFESTLLSNFAYIETEIGTHYSLDYAAIDGNGIFYLSFVPYENNGLQYAKSKLYKYNPQSGIVSELTLGNSSDSSLPIAQVSEDGLYAICKAEPYNRNKKGFLYSIKANLMEKVSDIEVFEFLPMKNQIVSESYDEDKKILGITIYNLPEFSIESHYQHESNSEGNFSPLNDYAMFYDINFLTNAKCHIIDVKTGNVLTTVYGNPRYIFSGKYVYRYNRRMKLNY